MKAAELKVAMRDAWRTVLDKPVADAKVAAQEAVREGFAILVTSLRVDAIESTFTAAPATRTFQRMFDLV